jgi:hypothetical protein
LEDAELFKNLIPIEMLVEMPLPILRRLREIQRMRKNARMARSQQQLTPQQIQNNNMKFDPTALGDLLSELE